MKSSKIIGFNIKFTDKDEEYDIFLSKKQGYYIFANSNTLVEAKYNILLNTSLKKANLILNRAQIQSVIQKIILMKRQI